MNGKILFTCKDHYYSSDRIFPSLPMQGSTHLRVSEEYSTGFMGFGLAITQGSCYELSLMEASERKKLLAHIYSKDGLGLSVGRICIGACDYSPEIYSYDDVPFDTELKHFSIERDEEYVIPMIKEILEANPDIQLLASPWSPPYWMKTGGSMCGGYMRDIYLDCYADYVIKFIKAYAEHGIKVAAITSQNEPNTQKEGNMPTCIWHPETEAKFMGILSEKFKENNLDVELWLYDHNFDDTERVLWQLENCEGLAELCNGVSFHYYGGTIEQTAIVKKKYPHLKLHFTEGGPRLTQNYDSDWCKWGLMLVKALKVGYSSFTGWNLILNEFGSPNVGPHMGVCGGFVTLDSRTNELSYSGQYKAYSHIAPFVTPESKLYTISVDERFDMQISNYPYCDKKLEGILIENPDGKKFAIIINPNTHGMQTQIEIGGALWYIEMHPDSIATLEIG